MRAKRRGSWAVTVGAGPCPTCGLDGDVVAAPAWWERLRGWLVYGQAPGPTMRCADGHEWTGGSTGWLAYGGGRPPSWWGWPVRVVRVLLDHRTAEPVPLLWLAAAVAGVTLGVVAQLTLGWAWWLVAVVWLLLVWLVFLATALSPSGRDGLWIGLVGTISSTRADRLEIEQLIRLVQAAPGPVYGLADWMGPRSLGGHGRSSSVGLTHLDLMYGDPPRGPYLRVNTVWRRPGRSDVQSDRLRRELSRELWHRQVQPPEELTPEGLHQWAIKRHAEIDGRPVPEWTPTRFLIDGTARMAEIFAEGDDWVAVIDLDDALVGIHSQRIPAHRVALTQVRDLTPFAEGSQQLRDRHQKRHPPT